MTVTTKLAHASTCTQQDKSGVAVWQWLTDLLLLNTTSVHCTCTQQLHILYVVLLRHQALATHQHCHGSRL